jgi:hypothetical protein
MPDDILIMSILYERIFSMANLSVSSIRERIFNTSKHESVTQRNSSNPFAASSFKGNVLTADVFESSNKKVNNTPNFTGKLKASALVGSISGIGEKFQHMINSVVEFGNRIKENVVNSFTPAKEKVISMYNSTKEVLGTSVTDLISSKTSARSVAKMEDMTMARQMMSDSVAAWEAAV